MLIEQIPLFCNLSYTLRKEKKHTGSQTTIARDLYLSLIYPVTDTWCLKREKVLGRERFLEGGGTSLVIKKKRMWMRKSSRSSMVETSFVLSKILRWTCELLKFIRLGSIKDTRSKCKLSSRKQFHYFCVQEILNISLEVDTA